MSDRLLVLLLGAALLLAVGCAGAGETGRALAEAPPSDRFRGSMLALAPPDSSVRTVQLYRGEDERALPVLMLGGDGTLTLEFDLLAAQGRPLSIYFYHADRSWQRDLVPVTYLTTFSDDDLLDYASSRETRVPYTHYVYRFPNRSIGFKVSGNYILRVAAQGREDAVLFERPFFVTEQTGALELGLRERMTTADAPPLQIPIARFTPPSDAVGTFGYEVCFMRNGRLADRRCDDRPQLAGGSGLTFALRGASAFASRSAPYLLDLSVLQVGAGIEAIDRTVAPPRVTLAPDYARFADLRHDVPPGQPLVRSAVRDAADPALTAEYVRVRFRFVPPDGQPLPGPLRVKGSFDGPAARGHPMRWMPAQGHYEGHVLVKQGRYLYRYTSPDPQAQAVLSRTLHFANNQYIAFVYYDDARLGTDRLLTVGSRVVR